MIVYSHYGFYSILPKTVQYIAQNKAYQLMKPY